MTANGTATSFRGSFTALVTPFKNGAVDEKAFRELVDPSLKFTKQMEEVNFLLSQSKLTATEVNTMAITYFNHNAKDLAKVHAKIPVPTIVPPADGVLSV